MSRALGLAASVLLVVSLGMWRQVGLITEQRQTAASEHRQQVARLDQEQQALRESHQDEVRRLQAAHDEAARELISQTLAVEAAEAATATALAPRGPRPEVNVPFAVLSPGRTRSAAESLRVPSGACLVMLIVRLGETPSYPEYSLRVARVGSEHPIWTGEGLTTRGAELSVALPKSLLSPGDYELRLFGLPRTGGESPEEISLDDYRLTVQGE